MERRDEVLLKKILSEIQIAESMLGKATLDEFVGNEQLKRAICMTVINVGELVKNLTDACRKNYSTLPWKAIAGFRDIAAHKYQTLRMADVYETVKQEFPIFYVEIDKILKIQNNLDNSK